MNESSIFGVSVRAFLALLVIGTLCLMAAADMGAQIYLALSNGAALDARDSLKVGDMGLVALAYFFGRASSAATNP